MSVDSAGLAARLGIKPGMVVQELGWDEDADEDLRDALLARGFGDALHATDADRGPSLRVDFVHTSGKVVVAAWDRCYRPGLAPGCPRRDRVFRSQREYAACHRRAVAHGRPGPGCGPGAYARYYSDHPVVTATVR